MSEQVLEVPEQEESPMAADELTLLKQQARMMGITFSNNIGVESLKKKIAEKMSAQEAVASGVPAPVLEEPVANPTPVVAVAPVGKPKSLRQKVYEENMKLVRLRITNLNPKKKDLPGEFYTVANEYLGTVRKFVPFGETTDEGYHVPYCIYKALKAKMFLNIRVTKTAAGREKIEQGMAREFALEVLPQLTPAELQKLAIAQKAAGNS